MITPPPQTSSPDPWAFIAQLTPQTSEVFCEYLESPFTLGEVLENKPATLHQRVLTELSVYFDVRRVGEQIDLYFKKEQ